MLLDKVAILFAPLKREGSWRNTLAWTRTTRSGSPSLLVDSVTCVVAVRVVDGAGVEEHGAEAAARSRRAMERSTQGAEAVGSVAPRFISRPKKCLFGPGVDLMEWFR